MTKNGIIYFVALILLNTVACQRAARVPASGAAPTDANQKPVTPDEAEATTATAVDAAVNRVARAFMEDPGAVALSVGVYKGGRSYTYSFGVIEKGKHPPATDTLYRIGSITKTFTGVLLAHAVLEGRVRLDDDVRKYLDGEYPNLEHQGEPVRLSHLLNHRSGLPFILPDDPGTLPGSDRPAPWTPERVAELTNSYTRKDFFRDLRAVKLNATPGSRFGYSNAAAQLAGYILERAFDRPYEELVKTRISQPLGMNDTVITLTRPQGSRLAPGHDDKGAPVPPAPGLEAAGALVSSVADLLKYAQWHATEKDEAVALSHRPTWTEPGGNYSAGLNWQMLKSPAGVRAIWQSGSLPGFTSLCVVYPELDMGMVVLANKQNAKVDALASQVMAALDARALALP